MISWLIVGVICIAAIAFDAGAQVVELRDAGPGVASEILSRALAGSHILIEPQSTPHVVRATSTLNGSVIALGRVVVLEGIVHGDVIVVGADLYLHPGARVDGRAVAMGGTVYESMLAHTGEVAIFGDFTYDIAPIPGGYSLSYRALSDPIVFPTFNLPGIKGVEIPTYDRTNGVSLPLAILVAIPHTRVTVEPRVTYRSQLGRLDPSIGASALLDRRTSARLDIGRATFTNDAWIWPDLINSTEYALFGDDARNYYRATRGRVKVSRLWETTASTLEPYVAAQLERATSVRPDSNASGGPWTLINRRGRDDVLRPNPLIDPTTSISVLAGAAWTGSSQGVMARARIDEEIGKTASFGSRTSPSGRFSGVSRFAQTTFDGGIAFPTFGLQRLAVEAHAVASLGSTTRQRWAYVGGPGTISTLDLLERGGDRLVYIDARYDIPFVRVRLPLIGSPVVTLRETLAGAGTSGFPTLAEASGARLAAGFVYVEVLVDPASRKVFPGAGLSVAR